MRICALDLALNCGYACNLDSEDFQCGTLHLTDQKETKSLREQRMDRRQDPRVMKFFHNIRKSQEKSKFDLFVFEDVEFSTYTYQCQLWSALRTALWTAVGNSALIECVPVTTLKKFATGHGGATKKMMCSALIRNDDRFLRCSSSDEHVIFRPDIEDPARPLTAAVRDDNAVDAVWLWKWAEKNLSRIKR